MVGGDGLSGVALLQTKLFGVRWDEDFQIDVVEGIKVGEDAAEKSASCLNRLVNCR